MNYKKFSIYLFLGFVYILGFTACDKNQSSNGLKIGTLSSDGQSVISNSPLNGYPLNFTIQNISAAGASIASQPSYWGITPQYTSTSFRADIIVNGYPMNITFQPTIYNFANAYYGIQTSSNMVQSANFYHEAKCSSAACETIYLNLIVFNGGTEYRQIGIKKSMTINRIMALTESAGNYSGSANWKTTDQLISELNSKSTL